MDIIVDLIACIIMWMAIYVEREKRLTGWGVFKAIVLMVIATQIIKWGEVTLTVLTK